MTNEDFYVSEANKIDQVRTFSHVSSNSCVLHQVDGAIAPAGQEFATRIGALYKETSALTGQGVSEVFNELCLEVRLTESWGCRRYVV